MLWGRLDKAGKRRSGNIPPRQGGWRGARGSKRSVHVALPTPLPRWRPPSWLLPWITQHAREYGSAVLGWLDPVALVGCLSGDPKGHWDGGPRAPKLDDSVYLGAYLILKAVTVSREAHEHDSGVNGGWWCLAAWAHASRMHDSGEGVKSPWRSACLGEKHPSVGGLCHAGKSQVSGCQTGPTATPHPLLWVKGWQRQGARLARCVEAPRSTPSKPRPLFRRRKWLPSCLASNLPTCKAWCSSGIA